MNLIFEMLGIIWQVFWGVISAIGSAIWQNLPAIVEIKKIMGNFTPVGMVALYLGVPVCIISAFVWVGKTIVKSR